MTQAIDKDQLYGKFQAGEDRRARFHERVAHKAVDLAMDDDMKIEANKIGLGTAGAIGVAAAAGLPGILAAAILGYAMMGQPAQPAAPATPATQPPAEQISEEELLRKLMLKFEVGHVDADGNPIKVPYITEMPKAAK